jgi:hypothetical protein
MPAATQKKGSPRYDVHPGVLMVQDWIATLKEKSGRSLDQWLALIKKEGPAAETERRDWLKKEHGLGTNTAWWLAERSVGKGGDEDTPEAYLATAAKYVEAMYSGGKSGLRPIHDRLIAVGRALGKDVRVCPCKTMVPLYRNHVFAQIKPSTQTRIDLGFALGPLIKEGKAKIPARLMDTGGLAKKDRITHRIPIASVGEIDAEVERWLAKAYELDA